MVMHLVVNIFFQQGNYIFLALDLAIVDTIDKDNSLL